MTTTDAPTVIDTTYGMGERVLAVLNALNDFHVMPCSMLTHGDDVSVQVASWERIEDAHADVDRIGDAFGLDPDDNDGRANYTRRGQATVHGVPMTLSIYTARPA